MTVSLRSASAFVAVVALVVFASVLSATAGPSRPLVETESELRSAISNAQPGDVITMANGTWTDTDIVFRATGTEQDSIRIVAETPGEVLLVGESSLRIAGDYLVVDGLRFEGTVSTGSNLIEFRDGSRQANHSRLTNSTIIDVTPRSPNQNTKWVSIYGTYNRVDHNYLRGKENLGTTLVVWLESGSRHQPTYHRIDNNHFGPRPPLGQNGGETIRIGTSDTSMQDAFVTVERNLFERCNGESEIISNKSGQNTFRGNTFFRSEGSLTLRHGNGALVEGNFFLGQRVDDTGGVRIVGEDHVVINNYFDLLGGDGFQSAITIMNGVPDSPLNRYFQVKNVVVAYNTFIRNEQTLTLGAGADSERTLPPDGVVFANNAIFSAGGTIVDQEAEPLNMTWPGTIYDGGTLGIPEPDGATEIAPRIRPSEGEEIWRPLDDSPVFDAAVAVPGLEVLLDFEGQPRDAQPDIGADERSAAPVTSRRLFPSDVGPNWPGATSGERTPDAVSPLRLGAAYPNPAVGVVTVPLTVRASERVEVLVYDALGRRVAVVADGLRTAGSHDVRWTPSGLAAGRYSVVARSPSGTARTSVVILPR